MLVSIINDCYIFEPREKNITNSFHAKPLIMASSKHHHKNSKGKARHPPPHPPSPPPKKSTGIPELSNCRSWHVGHLWRKLEISAVLETSKHRNACWDTSLKSQQHNIMRLYRTNTVLFNKSKAERQRNIPRKKLKFS